MKLLLTITLFIAAFSCQAQKVEPNEQVEYDTIFGLAVVIDTVEEIVYVQVPATEDPDGWVTIHADRKESRYKLSTAVIPAYTITTYQPAAFRVLSVPHVISVTYYRFEDCTDIPISKLIAFKH